MRELQPASNLPPSERLIAGAKFWRDWALAYQPGARVTAEIQRQLPEAIRQAEASLAPSPAQQLAVQIARIDDFATAFHVPADEMKTAAAIYRATLGHLPPDLLETAVNRAIQAHRWGMRLPLPAEIAAHVADELAERRKTLGRLEIARRAPTELPPRRRDPEEVAAVDALMAQWRATRDSIA